MIWFTRPYYLRGSATTTVNGDSLDDADCDLGVSEILLAVCACSGLLTVCGLVTVLVDDDLMFSSTAEAF